MPVISTDGQPVRYTVREGSRIVRRGTTQDPQEFLERERRINPNHIVTFHFNGRPSQASDA